MEKNAYGIYQPTKSSPEIPLSNIDITLMPLVAFDRSGNRLGMGGGFYDRTFAYKKRYPKQKPNLIGLAHDCQEAITITYEKWDIPLNRILTDTRTILVT